MSPTWSIAVGIAICHATQNDGMSRSCVEYRKRNAGTVRDSYPSPQITERIKSPGKRDYVFYVRRKLQQFGVRDCQDRWGENLRNLTTFEHWNRDYHFCSFCGTDSLRSGLWIYVHRTKLPKVTYSGHKLLETYTLLKLLHRNLDPYFFLSSKAEIVSNNKEVIPNKILSLGASIASWTETDSSATSSNGL